MQRWSGCILAVVAATAFAAAPSVAASKCNAAKVKAAGKYAGAALTCWSKAVKVGVGVDGACTSKAATKLAAAFGKAEGRGDCFRWDDLAGYQVLLDTFVTDATTALGTGGPSTCTSLKDKATGKKAAGDLACYAKEIGGDPSIPPDCLMRVADRFTRVFAKADARGDCLTGADAAAVTTMVTALVDSLVGLTIPPTTTSTTTTTLDCSAETWGCCTGPSGCGVEGTASSGLASLCTQNGWTLSPGRCSSSLCDVGCCYAGGPGSCGSAVGGIDFVSCVLVGGQFLAGLCPDPPFPTPPLSCGDSWPMCGGACSLGFCYNLGDACECF